METNKNQEFLFQLKRIHTFIKMVNNLNMDNSSVIEYLQILDPPSKKVESVGCKPLLKDKKTLDNYTPARRESGGYIGILMSIRHTFGFRIIIVPLNQIFSNLHTLLCTIKYRLSLITVYFTFTVHELWPFFSQKIGTFQVSG